MEKLPRSSRVTETGSGKVRRGRGGEDAGDHTASGPGLLQDVTPPRGTGARPGVVSSRVQCGCPPTLARPEVSPEVFTDHTEEEAFVFQILWPLLTNRRRSKPSGWQRLPAHL